MILSKENRGGKGKMCLKQGRYNIYVVSYIFFSISLGSDGNKCKKPLCE